MTTKLEEALAEIPKLMEGYTVRLDLRQIRSTYLPNALSAKEGKSGSAGLDQVVIPMAKKASMQELILLSQIGQCHLHKLLKEDLMLESIV